MNEPLSTGLNRRQFLSVSAAAVGVAITGLTRAAGQADRPYGNFTVGVQSYCFRNFNTEQALKRTHDLGLHYMEFFQKHAPQNSTPEQVKALLRLCGEYQITPIAWGVQGFTKNHDENKKIFEFAKSLGVKHLSADPSPDSFDSLDKLCEEHKITIAIHPHGLSGGKLHRWYSAKVILDAVKDHHPLIGTCLDTGHLIRAEQLGAKLDPAEEVRTMGARNFGIHLKDHDNKKRTDVIFGKGRLNVVEVVKALKDVKFKGYISLEYEAKPENPSEDMAACLEILRDAIKGVG